MVEETGTDNDRHSNEEVTPTPRLGVRPRPVSEQLLGKARLLAMSGNDDGKYPVLFIPSQDADPPACIGALSALDVVTNGFAQLIMKKQHLEPHPTPHPSDLLLLIHAWIATLRQRYREIPSREHCSR